MRNIFRVVGDNRRDILRIVVQTVSAVAATYSLMSWIGSPHTSWAVIAALMTIGLSADSSYYNALGRIGGAALGAGLGLGASLLLPPAMILVGLLVATALANAVATVKPSLRYAAVTAAIVTLDSSPDLDSTIARTVAIAVGTAVGAAASFVVWPAFGRERVAHALGRALEDCQRLLEVSTGEARDHRSYDAEHARFLGHLESARSRLASTRFRRQLPSGAGLSDAVNALASLWHAIVILDHALREGREDIDEDVIAELRSPLKDVQEAAQSFLASTRRSVPSAAPPDPPDGSLRNTVERARGAVYSAIDAAPPDLRIRLKGLHALIFALDEIEARLLELSAVLHARDLSTSQS